MLLFQHYAIKLAPAATAVNTVFPARCYCLGASVRFPLQAFQPEHAPGANDIKPCIHEGGGKISAPPARILSATYGNHRDLKRPSSVRVVYAESDTCAISGREAWRAQPDCDWLRFVKPPPLVFGVADWVRFANRYHRVFAVHLGSFRKNRKIDFALARIGFASQKCSSLFAFAKLAPFQRTPSVRRNTRRLGSFRKISKAPPVVPMSLPGVGFAS
jgi:hypothetical protein